MAKKSRRVKKKGQRVRLSPAQMVQPIGGETAEAPLAAAPVRAVPEASDLREEYRYVVADLKRIGIVAGAMLVVLIALVLILA
jgi:hypothetical protein